MSKEELKLWFLEKLNICYPVKHDDYPDRIYWYYDKSFVRSIKLSRINGSEVKLPAKVSGKCLFDQDIRVKYLWCDYNEIWSFLGKNYSDSHSDIQRFISGVLEDTDKLDLYTSNGVSYIIPCGLKDSDKLNVYTPNAYTPSGFGSIGFQELKDADKLNVYTPQPGSVVFSKSMKDTNKLNVYVPEVSGRVTLDVIEDVDKLNVYNK